MVKSWPSVPKQILQNHGLFFRPALDMLVQTHKSLFKNVHIQQGSTPQVSHGNAEFPIACPFKMTNFWPLPWNKWRNSFILRSTLSRSLEVGTWYQPRFLLEVSVSSPVGHWVKGPPIPSAHWLSTSPAPNLLSVQHQIVHLFKAEGRGTAKSNKTWHKAHYLGVPFIWISQGFL